MGDTYKGEEIAIIQDSKNFVVDATVDEYDISDIAQGMKAVIKTDATDDEELEGEVTFVAPTPNSTQGNAGNASNTSNYSIQITLKDKNDRLRVGMTAKTSIVLDSVTDVYAVAYDCIETDEAGNSYITVVDYDEELAAAVTSKTENGSSDSAADTASDAATDGEMPQRPDGEMPDGEMPDGEMSDGEMPQRPDGEMPEGMEPSTVSDNGAMGDRKKGKPGKTDEESGDQTSEEQTSDTKDTKSDSKDSDSSQQSTKRIPVTVGMESDYYVEISGDGLYEGMLVVTTVNKTTSSSDSSQKEDAAMFNMMGGGMGGNQGGNSGNRGGGAPSGGPGGF